MAKRTQLSGKLKKVRKPLKSSPGTHPNRRKMDLRWKPKFWNKGCGMESKQELAWKRSQKIALWIPQPNCYVESFMKTNPFEKGGDKGRTKHKHERTFF